jgi:L-lysine exporter family protein LysE/ArgO
MSHLLFTGALLGWGAAIPIGPICLEMIRRNLVSKTRHGIAFGFGACAADVTYVVLLLLGAAMILTHHRLIEVMGVIGALVLIWFGVSAFRMNPNNNAELVTNANKHSLVHAFEGYLLTLLNPMTILFWVSVSAQLALLSNQGRPAMLSLMGGVLFGTFSWVLVLNTFLHFTHRYLPQALMRNLNRIGGVLLLIFAGLCLKQVFFP